MHGDIGYKFFLLLLSEDQTQGIPARHAIIVKETYSTKENTTEQVDIKTILHDLHQGDLTITNYYNILGRHW